LPALCDNLFRVDHSCHQCGSPVESGVAFCPHCRAPQIRVPIEKSVGEVASPIEITAPRITDESFVDWHSALGAAALAGIVSALLMNLLFGFFGIGIAAAGALAVHFYRRKAGSAPLSSGAGARIGALSGLLGFVFFSVLGAGGLALFQGGTELKTALLTNLQQAAARSQDPQAQAALEKFKSPEGLMFLLSFSLVFVAFLFIALSALGGAIAASRTRPKVPR
jgi:hypothetical protein